MNRYLNLHRKKDSIILDILVHDHLKDSNATGARYMEAIFDVKTLQIDKSKFFYTESKKNFCRAADTKVMTVRRDYAQHADKLDIKCAEKYTTHPFDEALKDGFNSGGIHLINFGSFGKNGC